MGDVALQNRDKVLRLEAEVAKLPQVVLEVRHHFAPGMYARELTIPAGVTLTGKIHRHAHLNIVSKGSIAVMTEEGVKVITAPATFVSPPGTKRAGYALEDTVWTTIHPTQETDLAAIEAEVIAPDFPSIEGPR